MRNISYIIVHCSATKEGQDFGADDIRRWHLQRGFKDIGYHYVIRLDGTIEEGRPEEIVGAHCVNHNSNSIGICYIGGLDRNGKATDTRTAAQKLVMVGLLEDLMDRYPNAVIVGHRAISGVNKSCPCFNAEEEFRDLCKHNWRNVNGKDIKYGIFQKVKKLIDS